MAQQFVKSHTAPNVVVVFGKKGCPYCHMAVNCLEEYNLKPGHLKYVDFSGERIVEAIQQYFLERTGARTVPRIYFGETCIGGYTDLEAIQRSGEMESRLRNIGAM